MQAVRAQLAVDGKSNEIMERPERLGFLGRTATGQLR